MITFKWPKPKQLKIKLKDVLEENVDEKYYLSDDKIQSISKWNAHQKPFENMEKSHKNGYVGTITTREGDEQSGMKLIKETIKKEKLISKTFSQENVVSSKDDETTPTLTSTGAFSRHKIIENVFESGHHGGKIHNPEKIGPTFKENHGNGIFIKENTKKGFKEAFDGDGVYISHMDKKRGTVQKNMIQTIKTQPDVGVVIKMNGKKEGKVGDLQNINKVRDCAHRVYDGWHPTLQTKQPEEHILNEFRIRKITPREALRLMGVDDERISLIQDSKLVSHNKQYFVAGNSIVVQVLQSIFNNIDFPKDKPLKVFETFSGYGSQMIALENLGYEISKNSAISEWFIDAIISYALLHHNKEFYEKYNYFLDLPYGVKINGLSRKEWFINELSKWTLSTDSKKPNDLKRLDETKLMAILAAQMVSNNKGSILDIKGKDLDQYDLLTYSFPCQDLSLAGKSKGMAKGDNTRSGLLWEIERILDELKELGKLPKVLLMENVPQIHSKLHNYDFEKWHSKLIDLGYKNTWKDLNARDFGVPQNRNRTFMVSILDGEVEDETTVQITLF